MKKAKNKQQENEKLKQLFSEVMEEKISQLPEEEELNYEFSSKFKNAVKSITAEQTKEDGFFKRMLNSPARRSAFSGACCLILICAISISVGVFNKSDDRTNIDSGSQPSTFDSISSTKSKDKNKNTKKTVNTDSDYNGGYYYDEQNDNPDNKTNATKKADANQTFNSTNKYHINNTMTTDKALDIVTPQVSSEYNLYSKDIVSESEYVVVWTSSNDTLVYKQFLNVDASKNVGTRIEVGAYSGYFQNSNGKNELVWNDNNYQYILSSSVLEQNALVSIATTISK